MSVAFNNNSFMPANKYWFHPLPVYQHLSLKYFSYSTRNGVSALTKANNCSCEPLLHNTAENANICGTYIFCL